MKLEINYKGKTGKKKKTHKHMEVNNMLLNNQWVNEDSKRKPKNTWR